MTYSDTPLQEINYEAFKKAGVRVMVKREDLNHPFISGNKWWKLKYNLLQARQDGYKTVLTFGGAFSNHIYATAAAAFEEQLESIGIIRGEELTTSNHTLSFAQGRGMRLEFTSREVYRKKSEIQFIEQLRERFGKFYLIPEGGTNLLAVKGCAQFAKEKLNSILFDYFFLPVATGGTIAGIVSGFEGTKKIIGVSVLKGANTIQDEVEKLILQFSGQPYGNWSLLTSYHHGGYAKVTTELLDFVNAMKQHSLPLDEVYTGKLMWAIAKEIEVGNIPRGSTVLALHTGGQQGRFVNLKT